MLSSGWNHGPRARRLLILTKDPGAGRAKTRLAGVIGASAATDLAWAFLEDTIALAAAAARRLGAALEVHLTPHPPGERLGAAITAAGATAAPQVDGDLGQRLARALAAPGDRVVLGSDAPDLPASALDAAFRALSTHDVVLGPAGDGGYHLLGLAGEAPSSWLSRGIRWSSPATLEDTVRVAREAGLSTGNGPAWPDVDDAPGLLALRARLREAPAAAPRTRTWLDAHGALLDGLDRHRP